MKRLLTALATIIALTQVQWTTAQNIPAAAPKNLTKGSETGTAKPEATSEDLEGLFKTTLTRATLVGRWCSIREGVIGSSQDEKYTINSVMKVGGNLWLINASIQYGSRNFVAPIPVSVKWAGDTPVIIVDKVPVPGVGTYSARVMIYNRTYAGSWSGGDHAGLLNGVIRNADAT